ncbi:MULTISPECIES: hypothetical protein [Desertifilum]|uniref:hypothetical protein n=1 Tax=unclassified Desertifilum TaxID=2621682 RepID=UPI00114C98E0|nr:MULTISPECIES: hypothetical protein [Desertifilum]MBD2323785.1 hypothetical protein [Desertifilum sp. FACHB-866]MBD2333630.1 hypothetical protein [Desertifilum sp. FACHB-868]
MSRSNTALVRTEQRLSVESSRLSAAAQLHRYAALPSMGTVRLLWIYDIGYPSSVILRKALRFLNPRA